MHDPLPGRIVTSGSLFSTSLPVLLASETLCRGPRNVVCHTERLEPCHLKNSDSEVLALGMDFCTRNVSLALRLAGIAVPHRSTCPRLFVCVTQTWLFLLLVLCLVLALDLPEYSTIHLASGAPLRRLGDSCTRRIGRCPNIKAARPCFSRVQRHTKASVCRWLWQTSCEAPLVVVLETG